MYFVKNKTPSPEIAEFIDFDEDNLTSTVSRAYELVIPDEDVYEDITSKLEKQFSVDISKSEKGLYLPNMLVKMFEFSLDTNFLYQTR